MTGRIVGISLGMIAVGLGIGAGPPEGLDDWLFRPTVIVARGTSRGSGTVIASVSGETLVLTAAHVLEGKGEPKVEIHRYNLGLEKARDGKGWPKSIAATVAAVDRAADVAVLRMEGFEALPFVASLAAGQGEPGRGTVVTSVGIDGGAELASWTARVVDLARIDMEKGGGDRPFLLTDRRPDFGRSGGGLFVADGALVGVCVGRVDTVEGRGPGIFASGASVRRLLREGKLDGAVARSVARRLPLTEPISIERTRGVVPGAPVPR